MNARVRWLAVLVLLLFSLAAPSGRTPAQVAPVEAFEPPLQNYLVSFRLDAEMLSGGRIAVEEYFDRILSEWLPDLQLAVQEGSLKDFQPSLEAFGILLVEPRPDLFDRLASLPGVEKIEPVQAVKDGVEFGFRPEIREVLDEVPVAADMAVRPLPSPKSNELHFTNGHFQITLESNYIYGMAINPSAQVDYQLERDGSVLDSGSIISSSYDNSYYIYMYNDSDEYIEMQPGDVITVTEAGQSPQVQVVPAIRTNLNASEDTLWGDALPDAVLNYSFWKDGSIYSNSTTTDAEGNFSVDTTGLYDMPYGLQIDLHLIDPVTQNDIYGYFSGPSVIVRVNQFNISGYSGRDGYGIHEFLITFKDSGGNFLYAELAETRANGYFWFSANEIIRPEMIIEFDFPSGEVLEFVVPEFTGVADVAADSFTGIGVPNTPVSVSFYDRERADWEYVDGMTDGAGNYTLALVDSDITPRDEYWLYNDLPSGNRLSYYSYVPYIQITLNTQYLSGYLVPSTPITVELLDSAGEVKESIQRTTSSSGSFGVTFYSMLIEDSIRITPQGGDPIELQLHDLTIQGDPEANTIFGTVPPGSRVEVDVDYRDLDPWTNEVLLSATVDGDGNYQADTTSRHDLMPGDQVTVSVYNTEGNAVVKYIYLPHRVDYSDWGNWVRVYSLPSIEVTVTLGDSTKAVKAQVVGMTGPNGYLYIGTLGDIAPGDTLTVSGGGASFDLNVVELRVNDLDRSADTFELLGPASQTVGFWTWHGSFTHNQPATLDGSGLAFLDLAGEWDVQGGDPMQMSYMDLYRNRQLFESYIPNISIDRSYGRIMGSGAPGSTAVIYLKDSIGNIKQVFETTVGNQTSWQNGQYYLYIDPALIEDGDMIELHNGGQVISMTVLPLDLTLDRLADVASGHGPANEYAELWISSGFISDSYSSIITFDSGGAFDVDVSALLDIQNLGYGELAWYSPDGDSIIAGVDVPGISAAVPTGETYGYLSPGQVLAELEVRNGTGTLLSAKTEEAGSSNYYYTNGYCSTSQQPLEIQPGMRVRETGTPVEIAIPNVDAEFDVTNNTIHGTGPANTPLRIYFRHFIDSDQYSYSSLTTILPDGTFTMDVPDISPSDYAEFQWADADGDTSIFVLSQANRANLSAEIVDYPASARPNAPVFLEWSVSMDGNNISYSQLMYDFESHACDHDYRYGAGWGYSARNSADLTAPAAGTIYIAPMAVIGGLTIWGPEVAIPVMDITPVITDPVSGTTSLASPTLTGFAAPNSTLNFYDGAALLGSVEVANDGSFIYEVPNPLSNGLHLIKASEPGGLESNTVNLTVDNDLWVDPNHIFITDRYERMRIRDQGGFANLGGRVWIRPNDTVTIQLPVTCQNPQAVGVTVGNRSYSLELLEGTVWTGSFLVPSSDFAIIANLNCGGELDNILLTNGLIDPDGYVVDGESGQKLSGVKVTCYEWDEASHSFLPWDAATWGQSNPQYTDEEGYYSFIVPQGKFRVEVEAFGLYMYYVSPDLQVVDRPVRHNIELLTAENQVFLPNITSQ